MKTIYILFACMGLFTVSGIRAQNNAFAKSAMVVLVSEARKTFVKGTTYENWKNRYIGTATITGPENAFLKDIYKFLSEGQNPENVFRNYDGISLVNWAKSGQISAALNGSDAKCGFWCQLINALFGNERSYLIDLTNP